ncbi:oligosaccharide flippase family protein [Qipengyuania sp. 1NDH17]|uniref:Oligosaccharide flippase family protein n=1 Tax=Qipengyuania polymorpha TaxID=2867234 RepID=A0ABS7IUX4_9SPHN|nr:oligosaccharide flippase family protein [Qipengyuania polymorpha]MBX7457234.1 oligosaccharide flippase family protein [Qipengyuania polymorpha]
MGREADRRTVLKATAAVAASRALGFPLALGVSMWLTRVLTREEFAFFGVLSSLAILFAMFAQAGFQTSVVRLLGEAEAGDETFKKPSIFYASVIVTFVFSLILAILFYFVGRGLLPDIAGQSDWLFFLAAILLVARSVNTVAAQALRGIGRVGASANLSGQGEQGGMIRCLAILAGFALVVTTGVLTLEAAIWVAIAASVLCALWSAIILLRHTGMRFDARDIARTMNSRKQDNFNMMLSEALVYWTGVSAAVVIGGALVDAAAIAGMVAAFQLRNILTSPMTMIAGAVPNILIRLHREGDKEELERVLRTTASVSFVICLAACLFLLAIGPAGLRLIFGPDYGDAYYHLAIISGGIVFFVYCGLSGQSLLLLGDTRVQRRVMLVVTAITMPAYILLAIYLGAYGVSIGLVISMVLQKGLMIRAVRQNLDISTNAYLDPREYARAFRMLKRIVANRGKQGQG